MQLKNIFRFCLLLVCVITLTQSAGAQALKIKSKSILADKMKHREAVLAKAKSGQQQTTAANVQVPNGQPTINRIETNNNRAISANAPAVQAVAPAAQPPVSPAVKPVTRSGRSVKED